MLLDVRGHKEFREPGFTKDLHKFFEGARVLQCAEKLALVDEAAPFQDEFQLASVAQRHLPNLKRYFTSFIASSVP
jgi:hypothetical protein